MDTFGATIDVFQQHASRIRAIPLLQTIAAGQADARTWVRYVVPRLYKAGEPFSQENDLTAFESLLDATGRSAEHHGLIIVAGAVRDNFNQERGILQSARNLELAHATWREHFRVEIERLLRAQGMGDADFIPPPLHEAVSAYDAQLRAWIDEANALQEEPWEQLGAIMMLELCLREEFNAVLAGLEQSFPQLSNEGKLYVKDHARHEGDHFQELFNAVCASIAAEDSRHHLSITSCVLRGARKMAGLKEGVLLSC